MRTNRRRIAVTLAMTGAILACAGMLGCSLGAKWLTQPDRKPVGAAPPGLHAQEWPSPTQTESTCGLPMSARVHQLTVSETGRGRSRARRGICWRLTSTRSPDQLPHRGENHTAAHWTGPLAPRFDRPISIQIPTHPASPAPPLHGAK